MRLDSSGAVAVGIAHLLAQGARAVPAIHPSSPADVSGDAHAWELPLPSAASPHADLATGGSQSAGSHNKTGSTPTKPSAGLPPNGSPVNIVQWTPAHPLPATTTTTAYVTVTKLQTKTALETTTELRTVLRPQTLTGAVPSSTTSWNLTGWTPAFSLVSIYTGGPQSGPDAGGWMPEYIRAVTLAPTPSSETITPHASGDDPVNPPSSASPWGSAVETPFATRAGSAASYGSQGRPGSNPAFTGASYVNSTLASASSVYSNISLASRPTSRPSSSTNSTLSSSFGSSSLASSTSPGLASTTPNHNSTSASTWSNSTSVTSISSSTSASNLTTSNSSPGQTSLAPGLNTTSTLNTNSTSLPPHVSQSNATTVAPGPTGPGHNTSVPSSTSSAPSLPTRPPTNISDHCGPVAEYYDDTAVDWQSAGVGTWLNRWWDGNRADFPRSGGFAPSFGTQYLGNPYWTCRDDGSPDSCSFDPCDEPVLRNAGPDLQPAYLTLRSVRNLHNYFQGLSQSFQVSAIFAALAKDDWAYTFYKDKNDVSKTVLKEVFNAITTIIGVVAAFAAPYAAAVKISVAVAAALFVGAANGAKYTMETVPANDTPKKAAEVGRLLAGAFMNSITNFIAANNKLMGGEDFLSSGDVRAYVGSGAFVDFKGIDKQAVINKSRDMLASVAINYLWKKQKIFIMGGGPCDDSAGIGEGPQEAKLCRDGKAWYLFFWREYGGWHPFSSKQWGHVEKPTGWDQLANGDYTNITAQVIISSSLDAWLVGGNKYSYDTYLERTQKKIASGSIAPSEAGPALEGTFSIPVCDVSGVIPIEAKRFQQKKYILQPWGYGKIPCWCQPICTNSTGQPDRQTSLDFIAAAQMTNFDSIKINCPNRGRWTGW
ncbi:MAG: hypothetical protein M1832_005430 [Thelocarpon impressellum]|nr:MAG: hypothetical protein M1832_005430 [Thelocarpon impressellum]